MNGFVITIVLFLTFVILMVFLISRLKGKWAVYLIAVTSTLSAWFVGLLLDVNIDLGTDLSFRILLPILAMGLYILNFIMKNKTN